MPLYNDKDAVLDSIIDETNSNLHTIELKIKNCNEEILKLKNRLSALENSRDNIREKLETLRSMFKDYNKK